MLVAEVKPDCYEDITEVPENCPDFRQKTTFYVPAWTSEQKCVTTILLFALTEKWADDN